MADSSYTSASRSFDDTTRQNLQNTLIGYGANPAVVGSFSDEELFRALETQQTEDLERAERFQDRRETLSDFNTQLAALTGSKQRQALTMAHINDQAIRTKGIADMMNNF